MLEDLAAEELFAWLRDRGHVIDGTRWPDREREGRKGESEVGAKTVDLTFNEDGRPVAVDIVELHESARHARQHAEMDRIVGQLERELRAPLREINPGNSIAISWRLSWLPSGKILRAGLEVLKKTILDTAPRLRDGDRVDLDPKPDFVRDMCAICYASRTPKFGFMGGHVEQTGYVAKAAQAMAESLLASSKPTQLESFTDARVLAIDRAIMPFPDELQAALNAGAARIPANWTRIYFVIPWRRGSLSQVWARAITSAPVGSATHEVSGLETL